MSQPRILLTTEGTYPYATGGVSSWCDLLINRLDEFEWLVLPIVAPHGRPPTYELPPHARQVGPIEVWCEAVPTGPPPRPANGRDGDELPATLVRELIGWNGDAGAVIDALIWCRRFPTGVRRAFRSRHGWAGFLAALRGVLGERIPEAGLPPTMDLVEAAALYQRLYWVARTAGVATPPVDVALATAAGWSAVPALVDKALYGTPLVIAEHGVYVRESYLAAAACKEPPGTRFIATRLARGLALAAYAGADVVSPVTDANAIWESGLGIDPEKVVVIYNGLSPPAPPTPPPATRTVVSVGRIDPLKDVHTMLRVADATLTHVPDARFEHYGPVTDGEADYGRSCELLHASLGLGERFRFMGSTRDPNGVVRAADVALMTSISEGLPLSILEAMGQGRAVVATSVGGVPDVVKGCGVLAPPGDVHGLAMGLVTLLKNPALAWRLGRRGHLRAGRMFSDSACIDGYRSLLLGMVSECDDVLYAPMRAAA